MGDFNNTHLHTAMPAQKLPFSKKNKEWGEQCCSAIASMGNNRYLNGRTTWGRKQINYDLVNSIFNPDDYNYVLDPFGAGSPEKVGTQPARMRDINIIVNKINRLKGEEMTRPFNFSVVSTNGDGVTAKEEKKKEVLIQIAMQKLAKELGQPLEPSLDPETGEEIPPHFDQVDAYINYSVNDIREKWANDILNYLRYKESLELKFNEGWEHALIAAEEIYYIGIINGEPKLRVCNPLNCEYDRNPDNPNIEEGDWFREDRWMTAGQILDEYGEYLTDDQIDQLDKGNIKQGLSNQMFPGYAYSQDDIRKYEHGAFASRGRSNNTHYLIKHVVWRSMKKIGFLTYPDENNEDQTTVVDETFKLDAEMKAANYRIEWEWIPEVWHGTRIGNDFFVQIEPMSNQSRSMDNPHEVKLPYVGRIFNATNSVQTSLVDLIKPHQYLYNIVWFRLEAELAKAKGKKMVFDIAQIPKSQGIDMDKWMYFFDNVGIAFINSFEEGKDGQSAGEVSKFNQFQSIDMSLSNSVVGYITILSKIEQIVDRMIGMGPQQEGASTAHETAHGVQTSANNASYITEPWFYTHNEVKRKVLTQLIETAKFAYQGKKKIHYINDDMERIFIDIDMEKFCNSDYGIFVSNSSRDNMIIQKMERLAEIALNSDKASLSDVAKMYKAVSSSQLQKDIENGEIKRRQQTVEDQQAQQKQIDAQIQANAQQKEADRQWLSHENELDREAKIQEATIKTMGFDTDTADNGQIDVVKQADIFLKQNALTQKTQSEREKLQHASSEAAKDRALKERELTVKKQIEDKKAVVALKNKVTGEK